VDEWKVGSGEITLMPVVLGERGEAMMGAGKVWRLVGEYVRSRLSPISSRAAVLKSCIDGDGDGGACFSDANAAFVGLTVWLFSFESDRESSSHFPLTASMLPPTRCVRSHLRLPVADADGPIPPVPFEMEFDRDSDDVRSRIRVWYANGSTDELAFEDDDDDTEFELSMINYARRGVVDMG